MAEADVTFSPPHFISSPSTTLATADDSSRHSSSSSFLTFSNLTLPFTSISDSQTSHRRDEDFGSNDPHHQHHHHHHQQQQQHISLLAILFTLCRKFVVRERRKEDQLCVMEIGCPTDIRHVTHVTFDRFNGFLGLPVEFETDVPRSVPSASTQVFGVSTESMQLSYDSRGNSVPTVLLLLQRNMYAQGGLQVEGIFRINPDKNEEKYVRDQLNRGNLPEGVDVYCLAGLIKAWFRELPRGILDSLSTEQVIQCHTEEECVELVKRLPPTEAGLLDWVINLMADVVQMEEMNKMNAHSIAVVFAPNMTQMDDPLIALLYAVQVMNFLKNLILRNLRIREEFIIESASPSNQKPYDGSGHQDNSINYQEKNAKDVGDADKFFMAEKPALESSVDSDNNVSIIQEGVSSYSAPLEQVVSSRDRSLKNLSEGHTSIGEREEDSLDILLSGIQANGGTSDICPGRESVYRPAIEVTLPSDKNTTLRNLIQIDTSRKEWTETWQ